MLVKGATGTLYEITGMQVMKTFAFRLQAFTDKSI